MTSAVIGAIIYFIATAIVIQIGLSTNDLKLFSALIVATFLALPHLKSKYLSGTGRKGEETSAHEGVRISPAEKQGGRANA